LQEIESRFRGAFVFERKDVMAKTTSENRLIARKHARTAASTLAAIMRKRAASDASRAAAAKGLLDLALREPTRPLAGEANSAAPEIIEIVRTIVDPPPRPDDPRLVDGRGIGERSDAVLRTATPGQARP
jgi:hypothetical protein